MLPQDSAMLLSYINTKLRDEYASLDELCGDLECDRVEIERKLSAIGYTYQPAQNRFV